MDRPSQIRRALGRIFTDDDRDVLNLDEVSVFGENDHEGRPAPRAGRSRRDPEDDPEI